VVSVLNPRLGKALVTALSEMLPGIGIAPGSLHDGIGQIVVTAPAACPATECRSLVNAGSRVIILSPIPLASERRLYEEAGAFCYLPMAIDTTTLVANAIRLAGGYRAAVEPIEARATCSQESSPSAC
jgi:hypothetical protein